MTSATMMMPSKSGSRWVVAHSGARDQYQLPTAIHEAGELYKFVTDWYSPVDHPIFGPLLQCAPQSVRDTISGRFNPALPSRITKDLKLRGALKATFWKSSLDLKLDRLVGMNAARAASDSGSDLLISSYYGWAAFPQLTSATKKVLFQVHPHPWFLHDLYSKHVHSGTFGRGLKSETEMAVEDSVLRLWGQESLDADVVIAASSFTRKSLVYAGVKPERILVIPYGVDQRLFRNGATPSGNPKVLFVGQPISRKGFQQLLRIWEVLGNREAELHIVSAAGAESHPATSGGAVVWHGRLPLESLVTLMNQSDLLVLPSIAEGFGHVLLQSLSCGTPILCSDATAGPDLLKGWEEGFIFPSGDWDKFASSLEYWLCNVGRLRKLRGAARAVAVGLSWEIFRERIRNACSIALRPMRAHGAEL